MKALSPHILWGLLLLLLIEPVWANGGVVFEDIAAGGGAGLSYSRVRSQSDVKYDDIIASGFFFFDQIGDTPLKSRGAPGVAILDFDGDGDLDIYVTNGPDTPNSLFANQLAQTGQTTFIDVALAAGVGLTEQDSTGVCFGDLDNDGDEDLFVLSAFAPNRLLENNGDGTFTDLASSSGLSDDVKSSVSCSFGDIDNDGLLDVYVGNCCLDMSTQLATGTQEPFDFNQHSQLFRNLGGNVFVDVSATSGIENQQGFPPGFEGSPGVTWAAAMVDYDLDGDVDIFAAEDQAAVALARDGGTDRGLIHVWDNDGTGQFTDLTVSSQLNRAGAWMGLSFGDLNADGHLDLFGSNLGDYATTLLTPLDPVYGDFVNYQLGDMSSRWYLGSASGVFTDPGLGTIVATPFGWGTSMEDYDNDGDTDIIYHGGLLPGPVVQGAPGVILQNDGSAQFTRDAAALANSTDHERRTVQGIAMGDLNDDGFSDIVSVSNFDIPTSEPQSTYNHNWGSPFDGGKYQQFFLPTETPLLTAYSGLVFENGTLSVEINSGDNGNHSATIELLGTVGLTSGGQVNRDGIGAVVSFRTSRGKKAMKPVLGGASYASQDSLELVFGLERARHGQVDVLWPGGVRNRLYGVRRGERVTFPEIPCGFDQAWGNVFEYAACVSESLHELRSAGLISKREKGRFFLSAVLAFFDAH